jgi:hypothetical protein
MKPLNNLVVIACHTPRKCVRVLIGTTSIRLSKDNHDSWGMCTTSAECKIVVTVVLTVMSGMDPHMITWNLRWFWLVLSKWFSLGYGSVTMRLRDAIEFVIFQEMSSLLVH